jgi:hypothetical protein
MNQQDAHGGNPLDQELDFSEFLRMELLDSSPSSSLNDSDADSGGASVKISFGDVLLNDRVQARASTATVPFSLTKMQS